MTIRRNADWGTRVTVDRPRVARCDADVVLLQADSAPAVSSGNLHRSLGAPVPVESGEATELTIDALRCEVTSGTGGRTVIACADVRVGSWFSPRGLCVISNCGTWDDLDVAPGAHPNDGFAEKFVLDASSGIRTRLMARRRARTGTHLPHPLLSVSRVRETVVSRRGGQHLFIDSVRVADWDSVRVVVEPDSLRIVV